MADVNDLATSLTEQQTTTLRSIAAEARANSERWFPTVHDPEQAVVPLAVHYALGLAGEAGEVANLIKKGLRRGLELSEDGLADELADVFIYLLLLADEAGIDLLAAYEHKRDICEGRWGHDAPMTPAAGTRVVGYDELADFTEGDFDKVLRVVRGVL